MQLWDEEVICSSPSKVPPAEDTVEVQPEPSLDFQLQQLIVCPHAVSLVNEDTSTTGIVKYCKMYESEQHISATLANYVAFRTRGQASNQLWIEFHCGRLASS